MNSEYRKAYYERNKEKIKQQNRETVKRNPEAARERIRRFSKTPKGRYAQYKGGAKVRGLSFNMSFNTFYELINMSCFYCGGDGYGVDRIDPKIGYENGNLLPCCTECNLMKQSSTKDDFINKCKMIANKFKI